MRPVTDGAITVTLDQTREAMRLIAEKSRTVAEGAGALSLAAALSDPSLEGPIVCVVSGRQYRPGKVRRTGDRLKLLFHDPEIWGSASPNKFPAAHYRTLEDA
jgi:threonine dehydratase